MTGLLSAAALLTGTAVVVVGVVAVGVAGAARRAGFARHRTLGAVVAAVLIVWLGITAALAEAGVLSVWTDRPPRWQILPMTALATFALLSLTRSFGRLVATVPAWQPVALQTFRVGVELAFWRLHAEGLAPAQVTFEGRNFDVLVGLTAPFVAFAVASGRIGPRVTLAWNIFGLALLINAIVTVFTSAPGPVHLDWPCEPFTAIAAWPTVWIPALLAPVAVFLHVVSIRQSLARVAKGNMAEARF